MIIRLVVAALLFSSSCFGAVVDIQPFFLDNWKKVEEINESSIDKIQLINKDKKIIILYKGKTLGSISFEVMLKEKPKTPQAKAREIVAFQGSRIKFSENTQLEKNNNGWSIYRDKKLLGSLKVSKKYKAIRLGGKKYTGFDLDVIIEVANNSWGIVKYIASWKNPEGEGRLWLNAPYGQKRGFLSREIDSLFQQVISKNKSTFSYGQSFNFYSRPIHTHIEFNRMPGFSKNKVSSSLNNYESEYTYLFDGDRHSEIQLANYFSFSSSDKTDYLLASQYINKLQEKNAGISRAKVLPIAGASVGSQINKVDTWSALADKVVPAAKELGFKRIWIGQIPTKGQQFPFEYVDKKQAFKDLAYYAKTASNQGLETILWLETSTANKKSWLARNHPEWLLVQKQNKLAHYGGKKDVFILHAHEAYAQWFIEQITELKNNTSVGGLWLDSTELFLSSVDWRQGYPQNHFSTVSELIRKANDAGFTLYGEATSPLVISSYWVRKDRFNSYNEKEFALNFSSPYTNRPDSDFVDYFKAASFAAFPIIDIHPFIDDAEVYANQREFKDKIKYTNEIVETLIDRWFVDEFVVSAFDGGAVWSNEQVLALFFHQDTQEVNIKIHNAEVLMNSLFGKHDVNPIVNISAETINIKNIKKYQIIVLKRKA